MIAEYGNLISYTRLYCIINKTSLILIINTETNKILVRSTQSVLSMDTKVESFDLVSCHFLDHVSFFKNHYEKLQEI